tara:strand:- start:425 stop:3175 length:2751 start_codon:yes stop_codon:yes gene_type:complete
MAQIDLGKLKFQWRGNYADSTAYEVDDVVFDKGSTWIVVTAVANSNTSDPEANNKFERLSSGFNYRAAYSNSSTYYLNDLVLESNNIYRYINDTSSSGNAVSNGTYWQSFIPNAAGNGLSQPGDILVQNNANVASRVGVGTFLSQLVVSVDPREDFPTHEKVDYSVNTTGSNTAILTDQSGNNVGGGNNSTNASITLSRGRRYYFQVPTGATYSFKDVNKAGYSASGAGGKIDPCIAGVGTNTITGGGVFQFRPSTDVVGFPTTGIVLQNESGGSDKVQITLEPLRFTPQYRTDYRPSDANVDFKDGFTDVVHFSNNGRNIHTIGVGTNYTMPPFMKRFGAGNCSSTSPKSGIYRAGVFLPKDQKTRMWGNMYHDGSNNYYYWHGKAARDLTWQNCLISNLRFPNFVDAALAGNTAYAKFLTDSDGNDLNLQNRPDKTLKVKEVQTGYTAMMQLSENGIIFFSGYNGYGMSGNGLTAAYSTPVPIGYYDVDRSTPLTGANYPKIKMFHWSRSRGDTSQTYSSCYAIDTDGFLYTWGSNGYGQLHTGNTTNSYYASRIAKSNFGNRPVIYVTTSGVRYTSVYVITDDGKCWSWGQNDNGQLGINNETDQTSATEVTAVSGSPLNGKKIRHIMSTEGDQNIVRTFFLTTDGEVFFCGQNENYGNYSGLITPNSSVDIDMPTALIDAATTINSDGQKVVAMYCGGSRYSTQYFITDGGNSGHSASKVYACGDNSQGEMGTGSNLSDGNADGNWRLKEIEFDTGPEIMMTDVNSTQVTGTRSTFLTGGANAGRMKIGRIVKVISHSWQNNTTFPVVALDEFGTAWCTGEWAVYSPVRYYNRDNPIDFIGTADHTTRFVRMYQQPESFMDITVMSMSGEDQNTLMAVGVSGRCYTVGYGGWNTLGTGRAYTLDDWATPQLV